MSIEASQAPITRADLDALRAEIFSALGLLLRDPVRLSILTAPDDDEPYTEAQQISDEAAYAAVARGEFTTHEQMLKAFGL